jgi:acyl-CoA synthetase (NDP forming)
VPFLPSGLETMSLYPQMNPITDIADKMFYPKSVAVVGAVSDREKEYMAGWVGRLTRFGYGGKIYPVNPKAESVLDIPCYPSVPDIPGEVDYAIIATPAAAVNKVVGDCIKKQVKVVHVFSAGFVETGTLSGKRLQSELGRTLAAGSTRLIGPNCMGIYSPAGGLTFDTCFTKESGTIGLISQSGAGARRLVCLAQDRGLRFSKVISYGNGLDLNESDFLEYLIDDPDTHFVMVYLEGTKDGHRFLRALQRCIPAKQVILLKAGLSDSGAGAAASHTGSLAGNKQVWQALFRQTGAIPVSTIEEAVDLLIGIINIGDIPGMNLGIVGRGGGYGVIAADMCERHGLRVPKLTERTRALLAEITPAESGSSVRNPVEIGLGVYGLSQHYGKGLRLVADDPNIDAIITFLSPEDYLQYGSLGEGWAERLSADLIKAAREPRKPVAVTFLLGRNVQLFEEIIHIQEHLQNAGIASFTAIDSAVRTVSKLATYTNFKIQVQASARKI